MPLVAALRYTARRMFRRPRATLPALLCVATATALVAVVVAVTTGQESYLRRRLLGVTPHVIVSAERLEPLVPRRLVELDGGVVELVVNTPPTDRHEIKPRVEVATRARRSSSLVREVAPFVVLNGVYRNGSRYRVIEVRGIDPTRETRIGLLAPSLRRGSLDALKASPEGTIIGAMLARRLDVRTGDDVTLITAAGIIRRLRVVGIFRTDVIAVDEEQAFVNLELAQSLRGMARNAATGLSVQISDVREAERVAASVERATGYRTVTWEQEQADVLRAFGSRSLAAWIIAALSLVVAAFGIANSLSASLIARCEQRRAATGDAMGSALDVVLEALALGMFGGLLGAGAGFGVALWLSRNTPTGLGLAETFVRFDRFPVSLELPVFALTVGCSVLAALAASIAPARRASRRS